VVTRRDDGWIRRLRIQTRRVDDMTDPHGRRRGDGRPVLLSTCFQIGAADQQHALGTHVGVADRLRIAVVAVASLAAEVGDGFRRARDEEKFAYDSV
jgi:hypothetical protein